MRIFYSLLLFPLLIACASTGSGGSDVLEPLDPEVAEAPTPSPSPTLSALLEKLRALGYEGIGLTYESEATLDLLNKVFSSPVAANRQIRSVYTGAITTYDAKPQSLTVGGTSNVPAILSFIQKKVPAR